MKGSHKDLGARATVLLWELIEGNRLQILPAKGYNLQPRYKEKVNILSHSMSSNGANTHRQPMDGVKVGIK